MLPEDGGFLLCRAGAWGDQVNGVIIWPGDIDANMAKHGETVEADDGSTYLAVGGLPAAIVAGSSLGPSGFPYFGSDTGGYLNSPPDKETFIRWYQHTALSPVMQVGTNTNDLPWALGADKVLYPEVLDGYRKYARLHLRLFPYLWTHAQLIRTTGRAIQRPFGLMFPDIGVHPPDVYVLGDDLLVAPVVEPGAFKRDLTVPDGTWFSWWSGQKYTGVSNVFVDAPLDTLPLFARAGAPVPLLRPSIDTLSPVLDPIAIDSFATSPGALYIRVTPGPETTRTLYDATAITQTPTETGLRLTVEPGSVYAQGVVFELYAIGEAPNQITYDNGDVLTFHPEPDGLDNASHGWRFDADKKGTVTIKLSEGTQSIEVHSATLANP